MSYGLGVAGDARVDLQAMDSWLQEEFWDELEQLAADPSRLPTGFATDDLSYEFRRDHGGVRHLITLALFRNDSNRTLIVLGIEHEKTPLQS